MAARNRPTALRVTTGTRHAAVPSMPPRRGLELIRVARLAVRGDLAPLPTTRRTSLKTSHGLPPGLLVNERSAFPGSAGGISVASDNHSGRWLHGFVREAKALERKAFVQIVDGRGRPQRPAHALIAGRQQLCRATPTDGRPPGNGAGKVGRDAGRLRLRRWLHNRRGKPSPAADPPLKALDITRPPRSRRARRPPSSRRACLSRLHGPAHRPGPPGSS